MYLQGIRMIGMTAILHKSGQFGDQRQHFFDGYTSDSVVDDFGIGTIENALQDSRTFQTLSYNNT